MERIEDKKIYMNYFNAFDLDFLQSWQWGEIKKPQWVPVRIVHDEVPVSILLRKVPFCNKYFGYIPRGFNEQILNSEWLKDMLEFCNKKIKLSHLIIEPNLPQNEEYIQLFSNLLFRNTGKTIQPNQTNIIDLSKNENELWMDLRASFRRNIKKSGARFGCKVEKHESGAEAIERFNKVSAQIHTRNKFVKHTSTYLSKAWEILSADNMAKIFIVTHDGEEDRGKSQGQEKSKKDVAAYFLAYTKKRAFELYGGVTDEGKPLRAGHLLKWECIKDAQMSGLKFYDQWGVAKFIENKAQPEKSDFDKKDELYYISEFKSNFGGQYKEFMSQQTIIFNKTYFEIYSLMQNINKLKLKLIKLV